MTKADRLLYERSANGEKMLNTERGGNRPSYTTAQPAGFGRCLWAHNLVLAHLYLARWHPIPAIGPQAGGWPARHWCLHWKKQGHRGGTMTITRLPCLYFLWHAPVTRERYIIKTQVAEATFIRSQLRFFRILWLLKNPKWLLMQQQEWAEFWPTRIFPTNL